MVERHRNTQTVLFREVLPTTKRPLLMMLTWLPPRPCRTGGAGGELDIDRVFGIEVGAQPRAWRRAVPAAVDHGVEIEHARRGVGAHANDAFEMRQLGGGRRARGRSGKFGASSRSIPR